MTRGATPGPPTDPRAYALWEQRGGPATPSDRYRSLMARSSPRPRPPRWLLRLFVAVALGGALGAAGGVAAVNRLEPGHPGGIDSLALVSAPRRSTVPDSAELVQPPAAAAPAATVVDSLGADSAEAPPLDPAVVDSLARLDSLVTADSVAGGRPPRGRDTIRDPLRRPDTLSPAAPPRSPRPAAR